MSKSSVRKEGFSTKVPTAERTPTTTDPNRSGNLGRLATDTVTGRRRCARYPPDTRFGANCRKCRDDDGPGEHETKFEIGPQAREIPRKSLDILYQKQHRELCRKLVYNSITCCFRKAQYTPQEAKSCHIHACARRRGRAIFLFRENRIAPRADLTPWPCDASAVRSARVSNRRSPA